MNHFVLEFWHWWALALVLVVVEAMIPSGIFAGFALSTAIVGAFTMLNPDLSWQIQLGAVIGLGLLIGLPLMVYLRKRGVGTNAFQVKAKEMIGKEFVLKFGIQNGFGEIEDDGINWELKGPETKAGTKVKVVGTDAGMLVVYPVKEA